MNSIFAKTTAGTDEVRARLLGLPQRLRTVLIMADGSHSGVQLNEAAAQLGAPADAVQILFDMGLIAPSGAPQVRRGAAAPPAASAKAAKEAPPPAFAATPAEGERFRAAQKFMNDSAVDMLGLRAFFFTLKLEKCYTRADLLALVPDFGKAVGKAGGAQVASVLQARARELLG